jgi:hypothetical protein
MRIHLLYRVQDADKWKNFIVLSLDFSNREEKSA